ncbi:MAG: phosphoglycerate dehydrogenase [Deltaproteobacteria bacterium]
MSDAPFRVLVSDKLAPEGIQIFEGAAGVEVDNRPGLSAEDLLGIIHQYDGLAIRSGTKVTREVLDKATKLKVVGRAGIGTDNVDKPAASEKGVLVMNTPDGNVVTTAEHAISLMCSLMRNIPQATASMKAGRWEKSKFGGKELYDKTLGVVGLGNIGTIVANRARGLSMKVVAYDPFVTKERAANLGVELADLDTLLARADIVTLHVPLVDGTKNIISKDAIAKMKKGAFLVNAARGGLVDEAAVVAALESEHLAGAAFDVFEKEPPPADHPLLHRDDVILTPHLGASTTEAQVNVAVAVAQQIVAYLTQGVIQNAVNAPAVSPELMEVVGPYLDLSRKMGRMAGQLHAGGVEKVRAVFAGKSTELPEAPVTAALLTGLLESAFGRDVNPVSAPYLAKERGIEVVVERTTKAKAFSNGISLEVSGAKTTKIVGAMFGDETPRIVSVNGFSVEVVPEGRLLLTHHHDRPGMLGRIGTILGDNDVNISRLALARSSADSDVAKAVFSIDGVVPEAVLKTITEIDGIDWAKPIDLG